MAAWRYEISLLVLKNISLVRCAHSWNIFSTLEEKFRISARPCNILYVIKPRPQISAVFLEVKVNKRRGANSCKCGTFSYALWNLTFTRAYFYK